MVEAALAILKGLQAAGIPVDQAVKTLEALLGL